MTGVLPSWVMRDVSITAKAGGVGYDSPSGIHENTVKLWNAVTSTV